MEEVFSLFLIEEVGIFRNILYDAERWLLRHGIKQKAIHIE